MPLHQSKRKSSPPEKRTHGDLSITPTRLDVSRVSGPGERRRAVSLYVHLSPYQRLNIYIADPDELADDLRAAADWLEAERKS